MRTTLTLDDDVVFGLNKVKEASPEVPFKTIVNEALRRGLQTNNSGRKRQRFRVKGFNLGMREGINLDNIEEALDLIEGVHRR
jgi:hypothetical protein